MAKSIKRIDIKEFRRLGFLQEVNRQFFHPMGLALEVIIDEETGEEALGGVWDYREDPEGMFFGNEMINEERISSIKALKDSKRFERLMYAREHGFAVNSDSLQVKSE